MAERGGIRLTGTLVVAVNLSLTLSLSGGNVNLTVCCFVVALVKRSVKSNACFVRSWRAFAWHGILSENLNLINIKARVVKHFDSWYYFDIFLALDKHFT